MPWTRELFFGPSGLRRFIGQIASPGSKSTWRYSVRSILLCAERDRLTGVQDLTPAWLGSFPRREGLSAKQDQDERKISGRLLVKRNVWTEENYKLFKDVLKDSVSRRGDSKPAISAVKRRPVPNPPKELSELVRALAVGCGLSTGELRNIRVQDISSAGILVKPSWLGRPRPLRLIPFGDERDQLRKEVLDRLREADRPTDYLFFCKSPRDHRKQAGKTTLKAAAQARGGIATLVDRHFQEDFDHAVNLNELWSHWSNVHGVSDDHIRRLLKSYVNAATVFPVPAPYFLAAICASGCVPTSSKMLRNGKRRSNFQGLLDRYDITVEWPASLFEELSRTGPKAGAVGGRSERALRLLYNLAWEHWLVGQGRSTGRKGRTGVWSGERNLVDRLALTHVRVVDAQDTREWSGALFEFQNQKQGFAVPLIEEMTGGTWGGKCRACWHPRRTELDKEVSAILDHEKKRNLTPRQVKFVENLATGTKQKDAYLAAGYSAHDPDSSASHALATIKNQVPELPKLLDSHDLTAVRLLLHREKQPGLVQALTAVAEKFGGELSYQSLRGHAGLNPPVSGRGNTQRSHIVRASVAPLTRCPRALLNRLASMSRLPLILCGLLLATQREEREFSVASIQEQIALQVTVHEISLALNSLQQDPPLIREFQKTPSGFLVRR